jgi:tRNA threonylcarbamoyladenosine biosynthesis protein TsaB
MHGGNPNLLVLNSALNIPFTCLSRDGEAVSVHRASGARTFSQQGIGLVEKTLADGGLSLGEIGGFVFIAGPGSFTGIRIGLSMIKGMVFKEEKKAVSLSSLFLMAHPYLSQGVQVCPVMDARMDQIYTALYDGNQRTVLSPRAVAPEPFAMALEGEVRLVGEDAKAFEGIFRKNRKIQITFALPTQEDIIKTAAKVGWEEFQKGNTVPVSELEPLYLRRSYAEMKQSSPPAS